MTVVACDFRDITGESSEGTVYFSASKTRAAYSTPGVTITHLRVPIPLVEGKATSGELDPGQCVIELESPGVYARWVVNLPAEGTVTLAQLEEMGAVYEPAVVTRVMLAEQQIQADRERTEAAVALIPDFEEAAAQVFASAAEAAESAAASALSAEGSSAAESASVAARDESRSARDTSTATRDEILELASQVQADRAAAEEASESAVETTRAEVSAAIAELVDSAPENLDTLAEIAVALQDQGDAAAALTRTVAGKAPLKHEHEMGEIRSLPGVLEGKAEAVHSHPISQVDQLQATLDGINDALAMRARGNFDFVVASEPPRAGTAQNVMTVVVDGA